ncbi:SAM-dependent methyltransferase [Colwellia sp. MSW7]|uniref:SAM-dependent methyltransferase n=1 Tax=Colwellia maritima TaxID=2912588 RepID=A0ABS9WYQ5_9GAMM|nr:SAM-dependent methyltransferase [Colwellia maritima]MCI2283113.1 SAM-dependent methyltransferase [Colwellia maritima]
MPHSALLQQYLSSLQALKAKEQVPVLDLACGHGRNGLYLIENNIPVIFADVKGEILEQVKQSVEMLATDKQKLAHFWQVDFELINAASSASAPDHISPLQNKLFSAIIVFRYLHRPLFEQIKAAIIPGGMVIYETFTEQQALLGRPKNSDFLLKHGELASIFSDWKIVHSFEGIVDVSIQDNTQQAIAQIVAIKPN